MPHYEPLPSLAAQPFSLVIPVFPCRGKAPPIPDQAGDALVEFVRTFPLPGGVGEVITVEGAGGIARFGADSGHPVFEIPWEGEGGPWIAKAMALANFPRTLILASGEGQCLPSENDLKTMAEKLEMSHLVLFPRPQKNWHPISRKLWDLWMGTRKWIFALDPRGYPKWPGLASWFRRLAACWVMGVPGEDPESPLRMIRSNLSRGMVLQSRGNFVWVEMLAKATFLGALVEELPVSASEEGGASKPSRELPGPNWWKDFRTVFSNPQFGKPWSPVQEEGEKPDSESVSVTQVLF